MRAHGLRRLAARCAAALALPRGGEAALGPAAARRRLTTGLRQAIAGCAVSPGRPVRAALLQRRSVRVRCLDGLLLVGLPAEPMVVLEQQEGAGQAKRTERALP